MRFYLVLSWSQYETSPLELLITIFSLLSIMLVVLTIQIINE